jgi:hypothetical protein
MKRVDNLVNNGVDDEVFFTVKNNKGQAVKTPFQFGGKTYFPNENGDIRVANSANVKLMKEIYDFQNDKCDQIMSLCVISDEVAAYVLGLCLSDWLAYCGIGGCPIGCYMSDEMKMINCSVEELESLCDGSLLQTKCLSKMRKIVMCFLNNVNLEDFDDVIEKKNDMKTGKNNAQSLSVAPTLDPTFDASAVVANRGADTGTL